MRDASSAVSVVPAVDGGGRLPLRATLPEELASAADIELVDARRIVSLAHRDGDLPVRAPARIRRVALDKAREISSFPRLDVVERKASNVDPFVKYALRCPDGAVVEAVRIPLARAGRFGVCVSSQVGCALGCAFCATGQMGLTRNLQAWEIVEQVHAVMADLPPGGRVHAVVFQGMGEPLANADRVFSAVRVLSDPSAMKIDRRNITISTVGVVAGIRRLADEVPGVRLGISIGHVRPDQRRRLMPLEERTPLEEVLAAASDYTRSVGHAPMWAYTLLAGVNDSPADAVALARRARAFAEASGVRPRLSVIPYNAIPNAAFTRSRADVAAAFRATLLEEGVGCIVRYSGGGDVDAACGQLAARG